MSIKRVMTGLAVAGAALAQSSSSYTDPENGITFQGITDPTHNVTYGFVLPTSQNSTGEFIGEVVAPIAAGCVGVALAGQMVGDLLLVAWPDTSAGKIVSTTRYATGYSSPAVYAGPTITDLNSTTVNATHWKWVYRCENCTTWNGGSLNTNASSAVAWAYSSSAPVDPTSSNTTFHEHDDFGFFGMAWNNASSANYSSYV
ncbi:cytochrome domain of cellobiose dehydrogenase Hp3 Ph 7.5 [Coniophora puteana RWD-64-598 SS2]|uniref:Cytochrome domain of cellobiose dehydrogenase Hp3 Ph 7.5 n=1 Tax=Coniophora puteana (strain RWD-64-598) TaxID=741705 RepID=A0A5M3M9U4_CONPW|nr:cytochrome domain of cellobiose dehydrogenase Hp3 Ph 7.5 [Coniophora puteana RWD-64-598 SS2]EIW75959.1 cytochrome domain of cellobiose dehydrogenase Hp3 Ph 7.5 [Coniophora puteana RWD-64-598 SS2]